MEHPCPNASEPASSNAGDSGTAAAPSGARTTAKGIEAWLVKRLAQRLGREPGSLDVRESFFTFGLSSREAVALTGEMEEWLGRRISPTVVYEYPSIESLADHLSRQEPAAERETTAEESSPLSLEPIALVGIGCRFPGASGPEALWRLLCEGKEAIREVPPDRWDAMGLFDPDPTAPGKMITRWGGFLEQIDRFEPQFFRISPSEAGKIDPQHRLLLEVAWEAMEDAGLVPEQLSGTATGVFIGVATNDYGRLQGHDLRQIDGYAGTGNAMSIAANRLSYTFDLRGPSVAVDTACSSSLVAVHLACQSLWTKESSCALAGGVNVILAPEITINFSKVGALSPDGRCKVFDARADGFVRSEGAGLVVLKPLAKALQDGDPIYAVIRASAISQDGRTNGIMAPSRHGQEAVIRAAYRRAGLSPGDLQYVELHGTGTLLGDPIEAEALGAVVAQGRPAGPRCLVGSVKSNLGHLEAAAGVAGLIKVALAIKHRQIPPSLHFEKPNPYIPFDKLPLRVQQRLTAWPKDFGPPLAGVSSFGFGGTNAHVVVAAPRALPVPEERGSFGTAYLLPLSARTSESLDGLAEAYGRLLAADGPNSPSLHDLCYTASVRRTHHACRLAVVGGSREELRQRLAAFRGQSSPAGENTAGTSPSRDASLVMLFPDHGPQWLGVGQELLTEVRSFWEVLKQCDEVLAEQVGWSLLDAIAFAPDGESLDDPPIAEPVVCALQLAMASLWRWLGVRPRAVLGQGTGAVAAACAAGRLRLEEALRIAVERGRLRQTAGSAALVHTLPVKGWERSLLDRLADVVFSAPVDGPTVVAKPEPDLQDQILKSASLPAAVGHWSEEGCTTFLEIGPEATLAPTIAACLAAHGRPGQTLPTLRSGQEEWTAILESLGALYAAGQAVDFGKLYPEGGRCVRLPSYPWKRERYWLSARELPPQKPDEEPGPPDDSFRDWLYELAWQPQPKLSNGSPAPPVQTEAAWLIFADRSGVGQQLAARLHAQGRTAILVERGEAWQAFGEHHYSVRPGHSGDMASLLETVLADGIEVHPVVHLWSLDGPRETNLATIQEAQALGWESVLVLVQQLVVRGPWRQTPRLWLVTRGAQPVKPGPLAIGQAPLWGLGRTIALEHAELWGGLIDLDPQVAPLSCADQLLEEIGRPEENQVAWRDGERHVARLVRKRFPNPGHSSFTWRADASYLITGGLGDLGLSVARWMVHQGARRLILMGRSSLPSRHDWARVDAQSRQGRQIATLREVEALGASVHLASVDVADEEQLRRFLDQYRRELWPPIRGVVHAAGVVSQRMLLELDRASAAEVMRPKVLGGWLLHHLLSDPPLDFFVLFSSAFSLLGSPQLAHYAAANAFLDALAHHRRAQGLPGLSINWGAWGEVGMVARDLAAGQSLLQGVEPFAPAQGLQVLDGLMREEAPQVAALRIDWEQCFARYPMLREVPLLAEFRSEQRIASNATRRQALVRRELLGAPPEERPARLESYLRQRVAEVLGFAPEELDVHQPLHGLGMDSMMAMELKGRIESDLGLSIPLVHILQGPTVAECATLLADQLVAQVSEPTLHGELADEERRRDTEAVLNRLEALSDEEVSEMLSELLTAEKETV